MVEANVRIAGGKEDGGKGGVTEIEMMPVGCFYDDVMSLSPPGSHPTSPRRGSSVKSLREDAFAQQQQQHQKKVGSPRNAIEEAALSIKRASTILSTSSGKSSSRNSSQPNSPRKGASPQSPSPRSAGTRSPRPQPTMVVVQTQKPAGPTPSTNPTAGRQTPLTIPTPITYSARPVPVIMQDYRVINPYPPTSRDRVTSSSSTMTSWSDADLLDDIAQLSPRSRRKKKWNPVEEAKAQKGCAITLKRMYVT